MYKSKSKKILTNEIDKYLIEVYNHSVNQNNDWYNVCINTNIKVKDKHNLFLSNHVTGIVKSVALVVGGLKRSYRT